MKKFDRRDFIKTASVAAVAAGSASLLSCGDQKTNNSPAVITGKTYEWKMVTAWPPKFPILGEYAEKLARWIETMSQGRMKIQVYGGGELVPALEVFDAVSQGVAEMGHSAAYYWAGKVPAAQFYTSVPFGLNTMQMNAWLYDGGGLDLWTELYGKFNLVPFPAGNTAGQMGGWFNKEINSLNDLKGLKIRMPGLGGKVITKAGATSILSPGGELYTNLERGVIDALEWISPYHDQLMGFDKIAKYYYFPGWQEPTGTLELMVNKSAYDDLPDDLKEIIKISSAASNAMMLAVFNAKNAEYYIKMKNENIQFREWPEEILNKLKEYSVEVLEEMASGDPMSKKIYDSYKKFKDDIYAWTEISERNYKP
jgi:TRAP-type mannitol/chloroaromatic compound transport system substrate-binding protein